MSADRAKAKDGGAKDKAKAGKKAKGGGPAIDVKGIDFSYGTVKVLEGVNLTVGRGVTIGFVGPNGAGKTTTFSLIAGYLQPQVGTVQVLGASPHDVSQMKGRLAILPQDAQMVANVGILPQMMFFAELLGFERGKKAEAEALRVLEMVGLAEHVKKHPGHLSHGMHKRAGLAQAFIGDPEVVLLDEPTAGLDPFAAKQIRDLVVSMRGERTVMVSSHNLAEIQDISDEVALIHQGKMLRHAKIEEFTGRSDMITVAIRGGHPPVEWFQELEKLDGVRDVAFDPRFFRLTINLTGEGLGPEEIIKEVVSRVFQINLSIGEVQRGTRLEDVFMELTAGPDKPESA